MARAKIAIILPKHRRIAQDLAEQERRDSLRAILRDLIEEHGAPGPTDIKWAKRVLPPRGRG